MSTIAGHSDDPSQDSQHPLADNRAVYSPLVVSAAAGGMSTRSVAVSMPIASAAPDASSRTLRNGDKGDDVRALQQALVHAGFAAVKVDGRFGDGTEEAVRSFQEKLGLDADGQAGRLTLTKLGL